MMFKALGALLVTLILFAVGVSYPLAAMIGAALIFVVAWVPPREVYPFVDWTVLLFFAGLFIVTGAFEKAGYAQILLQWIGPALHTGSALDALRFAGLTAVLSNLVSNVPAVMLMQPLLRHLGSAESWWTQLALASTLAGNLTLIGSVANLIVAEKAHREGIHLGFWVYLAVGLPLTLVSMAIGALWLAWL
jgi:Na+/H+ antiporter NhaD/arsenite permease-like protein